MPGLSPADSVSLLVLMSSPGGSHRGAGGASPKAVVPSGEADPLNHVNPNMSHGNETNLNPAMVAQWLSIDL